MKPQTTKMLFAFISCTILSSAFIYAQQCNGPNKILVCRCSRASDFYCIYVCKCIHVNQLKEHVRDGWTVKTPPGAEESNETSSNPFTISMINSTSINVKIAGSKTVSLRIFDLNGKLIKTLANSRMPGGEHQIEWDKRDEAGNTISNGIYILQFNAGSYSGTRKLAVI